MTDARTVRTCGPGIRSGAVPVLADGFISRPESVPDLAALAPGTQTSG
jgi:hypothetical protein